ncbi:MAG: NAD(P)H-dependent oxidoreductase subunit E [Blastocatellia bacterium]|nr:NAD(P)H-dependent oxidoreductase subunit E [Blastocatellia bacterium]
MNNGGERRQKIGAALVVGGGIGGMQAALDLADAGIKVYLVDAKPAIGGVMSQLDKTFPTNDCAMCTMAPRLVAIGRHKDIEVLTLSEVERIEGEPGNFTVTLRRRPRFVDESICTGCGSCVTNCPVRFIPQPLDGVPPVTLAPDVQARVDQIIAEHRHRPGPLMPILQSINAVYNYFPEDVLRYVSQQLGIPLAQILRVATFYNAFSIVPRGKHIINVCMGTTCYVRGSERLMERFADLLKIKPEETTPDMLFTLKSVRCIGCCGLAPAVMIGDAVFGKLTVKEVSGILKKYHGANGHAQIDAG